MADDQKSFWTTLPGLFTGLAALISAAAGLIAVFNSHGSTPAPQPAPQVVTQPVTQNIPPVSTPSATPSTTPSTAPSGLPGITGFWSGPTEGLRMAVLNLAGSPPNLSGTFERPCGSARLFDIQSAILRGTSLTVTIANLPRNARTGEAPAPIEMDLQWRGGKLSGTFNQGKVHAPITLTPGKQACPNGGG